MAESFGNLRDLTGKEDESRMCQCSTFLHAQRGGEISAKVGGHQSYSFRVAIPSMARLIVSTLRKWRPVSIIRPR